MPTLITNPSAGSSIPVPKFQVVEGGCGGNDADQNRDNLNGIPAVKKAMPEGPIPLDQNVMIPAEFLADLNPSAIGVNGPRAIRCGSVNMYQVVNFDSYTVYSLSAAAGSVELINGHVYYTAPDDAGACGFTIDGRFIPLTAVEGLIHKPSIIAPVQDFVPVTGVFSVIGSVFASVDTGPVYETFTGADLEISSVADFSTIKRAIYNNGSTVFEISGFTPEEQTYFRIRYHGKERTSEWSETRRLKGVAAYIKPPVLVSPVQGGTSGVPNPSDVHKVKPVVTVTVNVFGTENLTESFVSSDIEIATTIDFSNIVSSTYGATGAETNWQSGLLEYGTLYFIRMKHNGQTHVSDWSTPVSFMTIPDPRSVAKPVIGTPVPDATKVALSYMLPGSAFSAQGYVDNLVNVEWEVATDIGFTSGKQSGTSLTVNTGPLLLQYSTNYYARVRYNGTYASSPWSDVVNFVSVADDRTVVKPVVSTPANNSVGISVTPAAIASAFATSSPSTAFTDTHVSSDWELSTQANFSSLIASVYDSAANKLNWNPSGLSYSTGYYLRTRQKGQLKVSDWSTPVFFTVMADNRYIATPLTSVLNSGASDPRPYVSGTAFNPVNHSDTHVSTDWQISFDVNAFNLAAWSSGNTSELTAWRPNIALAYGTTYWARHRYHGTVKTSDWSPVAMFTVMADNRAIQTPSLPANAYAAAYAPLAIQASAFTPVNFTDTFSYAVWEISGQASNPGSHTGGDTFTILTQTGTAYARVMYVGASGVSSGWSNTCSIRYEGG